MTLFSITCSHGSQEPEAQGLEGKTGLQAGASTAPEEPTQGLPSVLPRPFVSEWNIKGQTVLLCGNNW